MAKITETMIQAGHQAIKDNRGNVAESLVEKIYEAMEAARGEEHSPKVAGYLQLQSDLQAMREIYGQEISELRDRVAELEKSYQSVMDFRRLERKIEGIQEAFETWRTT